MAPYGTPASVTGSDQRDCTSADTSGFIQRQAVAQCNTATLQQEMTKYDENVWWSYHVISLSYPPMVNQPQLIQDLKSLPSHQCVQCLEKALVETHSGIWSLNSFRWMRGHQLTLSEAKSPSSVMSASGFLAMKYEVVQLAAMIWF